MNNRAASQGALLLAPLLCGIVHAEPQPKAPKVNDPALRIELVAAVPEVEACTTVCSDPHGAIYIGNDPRDGRLNTKEPVCMIVRLSEVTPAKGGPRKRTVFADNFYSPAGSAWHDGWLYVIHDPLMSRFKDTDADGVADLREDLISNLGHVPYEGLNDHCVSGFTLGMDGFFYLSVGDRGIYQAKSARNGSTLTMQGGGIVRCRPDGTELEIFSTGTRNHLSVNLDAEDNAFTRDNTDDGNGWWTRLTHHIEGGDYGYPYDYRRVANYGVTQPSKETLAAIRQHGIGNLGISGLRDSGNSASAPDFDSGNGQLFLPAMTDFGGGSPTGGLCYLSDGLPEKYRGKHFFSEWGKAGLFVTELARDGATFKLVSDTKLVEPGKGGEFRPMQIAVAHDGSLLIADWGYGGWKSPRVAGAVWRLYWPEAKCTPRLKDESKATVEELITALGHPDRDQRLRAQSALAGKDRIVAEKLAALVKDESSSETPRIHAVWAVKAMLDCASRAGANPEPFATDVLHAFKASNPRVQAQAARAIGQITHPFQFELLAPGLRDADPVVRLQVAAALGRTYQFGIGGARAFGASETNRLRKAIIGPIIDALADPDTWVRFAARKAFVRANDWKDPVPAPHRSTNSKVRESTWLALSEVYDEQALELLIAGSQASEANSRIRSITALGCIAFQPKAYDGHWWATQPVKSPPPPKRVAWRGTPQALEALTAALADTDAGVRFASAHAFTQFLLGTVGTSAPIETAVSLSVGKAGTALRARLEAETDATVRRQLIESLGVQRDPEAVTAFARIALDEKGDPAFRQTAIAALVKVGDDRGRKAIAQLAVAALSPAATEQVLAAIGALKVTEAAPVLLRHLRGSDETLATAATKALGALGPKSWPPETESALLATLDGRPHAIQKAAIELLAGAKVKAALPRLIAMVEANELRKEALTALAAMPDAQSLPVLVAALPDKDGATRRAVLKALKTLREQALPLIEQEIASGAIPPELVSEIRGAFDTGVITQWKMIGPFENVWGAVHPVESDLLPKSGDEAIDRVQQVRGVLARRYLTAEGKEAGWIDVVADPETGRVNLEKLFKTNAMVCAYAFAEIHSAEPADAKLFCGSDDQIAVWLNGAKVHDASGSRGFEPDKDEAPLRLVAGVNQLLVKIGNNGGGWEFAVRLPGLDGTTFRPGKVAAPEEKQRAFALATKPDGSWLHPGNARRGEKLFHDPNAALKGICATCHAVGAFGGQIGPNLSMVGAVYPRADLITSILEPSKTNALGFEQVMIEMRDSQTLIGAVRQENPDELTVIGADGKPHVLKKSEVKARELLPISMMPPGLTLGLQPEEFADLLAYLESLRGQ